MFARAFLSNLIDFKDHFLNQMIIFYFRELMEKSKSITALKMR